MHACSETVQGLLPIFQLVIVAFMLLLPLGVFVFRLKAAQQ